MLIIYESFRCTAQLTLVSGVTIFVWIPRFSMEPVISWLFLTMHVHVWATLKGYEGERKAVALASRLRDVAVFSNSPSLDPEVTPAV